MQAVRAILHLNTTAGLVSDRKSTLERQTTAPFTVWASSISKGLEEKS